MGLSDALSAFMSAMFTMFSTVTVGVFIFLYIIFLHIPLAVWGGLLVYSYFYVCNKKEYKKSAKTLAAEQELSNTGSNDVNAVSDTATDTVTDTVTDGAKIVGDTIQAGAQESAEIVQHTASGDATLAGTHNYVMSSISAIFNGLFAFLGGAQRETNEVIRDTLDKPVDKIVQETIIYKLIKYIFFLIKDFFFRIIKFIVFVFVFGFTLLIPYAFLLFYWLFVKLPGKCGGKM